MALRQNADRRKDDEDALLRDYRDKVARLEKDNVGLQASLAEASAKEQLVSTQLRSVRAALGLA